MVNENYKGNSGQQCQNMTFYGGGDLLYEQTYFLSHLHLMKDCETHYRGEGYILIAGERYTSQVTFQISLLCKNTNLLYL